MNKIPPAEIDPSNLPDVPAFQDEFTRDFIQSTEPIKEGYYSFKSGTDSFIMDFPGDMTIGKRSYNIIRNNWSETIVISYPDYDRNAFIILNLHYYSPQSSVERSKEQMSISSGRELNFKPLKSKYENQTLETSEYEDGPLSVISGLLYSSDNQEIRIHTIIVCKDGVEEGECLKSKESQNKKALKILQSIQILEGEN